jgi:hypothetical protein
MTHNVVLSDAHDREQRNGLALARAAIRLNCGAFTSNDQIVWLLEVQSIPALFEMVFADREFHPHKSHAYQTWLGGRRRLSRKYVPR